MSFQTAVQDQTVSIGLFQMHRIHTGFDFQRIEGVQADLDQFGQKGIDVTAGMQVGLDAPGMRPVSSSPAWGS